MKLSEIFEIVDARWGKSHTYQAAQTKEKIQGTVDSFGEGFAVLIGGRLIEFLGDIGAARHRGRYWSQMSKANGWYKPEDVKVKRVKV